MKGKFFEFLLFVYVEHIREDWDDYNALGRAVVYPLWWIRSAFVWALSPFLLIEYIFTRSKFYQEFLNHVAEMERAAKSKP